MSVKIDVVTPIVWTTVVEAEGKHTAKLPVSQLPKQQVPGLSDESGARPLMSTFPHPGAAVLIYSPQFQVLQQEHNQQFSYSNYQLDPWLIAIISLEQASVGTDTILP